MQQRAKWRWNGEHRFSLNYGPWKCGGKTYHFIFYVKYTAVAFNQRIWMFSSFSFILFFFILNRILQMFVLKAQRMTAVKRIKNICRYSLLTIILPWWNDSLLREIPCKMWLINSLTLNLINSHSKDLIRWIFPFIITHRKFFIWFIFVRFLIWI